MYDGVMSDLADQNAIVNGRTFVWHELYVPDVDAAIEFYTQALDFGTTESDMGSMGTYKMLTRNGVPVCGTMSTNLPEMPNVPPHWAAYVSVDDLDARVAKCQEHGAELVVPAIDVPTIGRMSLIKDPQGAHIWLFEPAR